jgi:predicted nucleic acid-binding protein
MNIKVYFIFGAGCRERLDSIWHSNSIINYTEEEIYREIFSIIQYLKQTFEL